jgi:hypothetical protein
LVLLATVDEVIVQPTKKETPVDLDRTAHDRPLLRATTVALPGRAPTYPSAVATATSGGAASAESTVKLPT